ncbi:MAG: FxsA family protein [Elusimicrobiota bacterium]
MRKQRPPILLYLILLFTVIPLTELALLIKIGQYIGVFYTILIVLITGVVGASLARVQGFLVLKKINRELSQGIMPSDHLFDGALILVGGVTLLTPGFLTDFAGFMVLIPATRDIIKKLIKRKVKKHINSGFYRY